MKEMASKFQKLHVVWSESESSVYDVKRQSRTKPITLQAFSGTYTFYPNGTVILFDGVNTRSAKCIGWWIEKE